MKQFFKFMFASMLGTILTFIIFLFIMMGIIASVLSFSKEELVPVPDNCILHLKFDEPILDRSSKNPISLYDFSSMSLKEKLGLNDILKNIEKAKSDPKIRGIYLNLSIIPSGFATIEEIRNSLIEFKESGKFIISYSNSYTQGAYYLASVSDKVFLNPNGFIFFKGLNAQVTFFKGALNKLDIEPQIIRQGKYKSAIEPFIKEKLSEANQEQLQMLVNSFWNNVLEAISTSRNIPIGELNLLADNLSLRSADDALKHNFVDDLLYKDELIDAIHTLLSIPKSKEIQSISIEDYNFAPTILPKKKYTRNKIAVIYALGTILQGKGDDGTIGSERLSRTIREARENKDVKAIVLRVNSPGGDFLASEIIWREVKLARNEKPLIVSMGDVAASGGYMISSPATKILADPTTLTGSIGAFGIIPNFQKFLNNLGITFDNVKTNKNSDFFNLVEPLTEFQKSLLDREIERIYKQFVKQVAEDRNMTIEQVNDIGQGRIWSGTDALEIGLIDEFGGLEKAIQTAADLAELDNYRIISLPKQKDPLVQLMEDLMGGGTSTLIESELGNNYKYYEYLKTMSQMKGVHLRMPYEIEVY
ncbi:MAG: signal peptide peptidase SppA [Bacteroidales bacterium]|nr:signal peptide peptidase SppA [Bacteroidales bacterium]